MSIPLRQHAHLNRIVPVYVPSPTAGSWSRIVRPGSAILGSYELEKDRVRIDYEGAVYGQANLKTFADRARTAHGRHVERYPTIARAWVMRSDLTMVGVYDPMERRVEVTDSASLAVWLDVPTVDEQEYRCT